MIDFSADPKIGYEENKPFTELIKSNNQIGQIFPIVIFSRGDFQNTKYKIQKIKSGR
jgi:hypothetical protein